MPSTISPEPSLGAATIPQPQLSALMRRKQQMVDRGGNRSFGKLAQPGRRRPAVEDAREIGEGDQEGHLALDDAQPAHHHGFRRRCPLAVPLPAAPRLGDQRLDLRLQRLGDGTSEDGGIEIDDFAQIRRQRQHGRDEIAKRRLPSSASQRPTARSCRPPEGRPAPASTPSGSADAAALRPHPSDHASISSACALLL